eukprot:TRINITY_DN6623_c0_g1_i3.p1 TRINITY_DN6623_c0_g1~~TRINITY_DN6623_c0_g1_i3.p1  ORF type:complete len:664 (-),score=128.62 TRINITY_DN6623_c0_g1_i3:13-2004(-)
MHPAPAVTAASHSFVEATLRLQAVAADLTGSFVDGNSMTQKWAQESGAIEARLTEHDEALLNYNHYKHKLRALQENAQADGQSKIPSTEKKLKAAREAYQQCRGALLGELSDTIDLRNELSVPLLTHAMHSLLLFLSDGADVVAPTLPDLVFLGNDVQQSQSPLTLRFVLRNPTAIKYFLRFLTQQYSVDVLKFWVECEKFSRISDETERKEQADRLVSLYLAPNAINSVASLDQPLVQRALNTVGGGELTPRVFADIQQCAFQLLLRDHFPRFQRAALFQEMQQALFAEARQDILAFVRQDQLRMKQNAHQIQKTALTNPLFTQSQTISALTESRPASRHRSTSLPDSSEIQRATLAAKAADARVSIAPALINDYAPQGQKPAQFFSSVEPSAVPVRATPTVAIAGFFTTSDKPATEASVSLPPDAGAGFAIPVAQTGARPATSAAPGGASAQSQQAKRAWGRQRMNSENPGESDIMISAPFEVVHEGGSVLLSTLARVGIAPTAPTLIAPAQAHPAAGQVSALELRRDFQTLHNLNFHPPRGAIPVEPNEDPEEQERRFQAIDSLLQAQQRVPSTAEHWRAVQTKLESSGAVRPPPPPLAAGREAAPPPTKPTGKESEGVAPTAPSSGLSASASSRRIVAQSESEWVISGSDDSDSDGPQL